MPGFPVLHYLPEFAQTHIHLMLFNHLILCHLLLFLPSIFSSVSALHIRWPKYWSFSISPSNEYSGLSSFRIDWFDLLAVQETLKILLHHYNSKASILQHPAFFMVQLSHSYKTTGKITASTQLQFSSVTQLCPTLCNLMNRSTAGLPVHHQLPEFTQTHVHRAGDAIQPSHALWVPSPPAFNFSQYQGLSQ